MILSGASSTQLGSPANQRLNKYTLNTTSNVPGGIVLSGIHREQSTLNE